VARRYRIPGLIDLTFVSDPEDIRALAADPALDRRFERRGPLVNRLVAGRIRRWFQADGRPIPPLSPRGDADRAARQKSLRASLEPGAGQPLWTEPQLQRLVAFVQGRLPAEEAGVTLQEIVGQRYNPAYVADRASWEAARMLDDFRDRFVSPRHLVWLVTGRLRRARALLVERAGNDRHALHGTAVGLHGVMGALERMRELRAHPQSGSINDRMALSRCLHPPRRVPRTVEAMVTTAATARPLPPGAIVLLELEQAGSRAPDPDITFMHGSWNFCPAEAFVPALLKAVWRGAA
jgi:hypothetical protein